MKRRYDFSKGIRGKFHSPNAVFRLPVYLDKKVETYLAAKAAAKGIELSNLVNDLLRKEIEIIEEMTAQKEYPETATKFDLARAYLDMGDAEGAIAILDEIIKEDGDEKHVHARLRKAKNQ